MVLEDTPIFNADIFNEIKTIFPKSDDNGKRDLRKRVDVVEKFIKYLEDEERLETVESQIFVKNIVSSIKRGADCDIQRIKNKLAK